MPKTKLAIDPKNRIDWNTFQRGRYARRISGNKVAPEIIRRRYSKGDAHLRAAYDGERGPGFPSESELKRTEEHFSESS